MSEKVKEVSVVNSSVLEEEGEETPNGFDPEDPFDAEGPEPEVEEAPAMPLGFQLLQHVDSPEPEEPDEAGTL